MTTEPTIDARTACAIAAAMRAVALADGDMHPRELALIDAFEAEVRDDVDPSGVTITDPAIRRVLLHSMVATAMADGIIGPLELDVIHELARAHGASPEDVEATIGAVRREMLAHFRGVTVFREEAMLIARGLGLTDAEAAEVLD